MLRDKIEVENIAKGLLIASINAYLKGNGETKIVFSADEIARAAGFEDAKSARETIHEAMRALQDISISYDNFETRIVTATFLKDDNCIIDLVEGVVSLFKLIET